MNFSLLFLCLVLTLIQHSHNTIQCLSNSMISNKTICAIYNQTNPILYIRPCDTGYYCNYKNDYAFLPEEYQEYYCEQIPPINLLGASCNLNSDCLSNNCTNGICSANQINYPCTVNSDCENDAYCNNNNTCQRLADENEECNENILCRYGYLCAPKVNGSDYTQCLKLYSIETGKYAFAPELCESGIMDHNYICVSTSLRMYDVNFDTCNSEYDCTVIVDKGGVKYFYENDCKPFLDEKSRCAVVSESDEWENYVKVTHDEMKNKTYPLWNGINMLHLSYKLRKAYVEKSVGSDISDCVVRAVVQKYLMGNASGWIKMKVALLIGIVLLIS